ncbi:hypothetical protein [Leptolyngbya sp. FACHB-261]|uniref:hypothetical protein n=1 Tax=Leptolyngbya sp. FACHB-261 TaxID=2692806 RepID=UPI0016850D85|nr:hypothetical protein [Leptolyngbya sp. FACHB-261]MBD2101714.1 hypothetical protein [Leptolyngbya sp. FACHB-261]
MGKNLVSAHMSLEDRKVIADAVTLLHETMPFLLDLTSAERRAFPKMGDKGRAFISRALEVATQNPDFLPRAFDLEEMRRDIELFDALYPVWLALIRLEELVGNTCLAASSEAYSSALEIYSYAKSSSAKGMDSTLSEMGRRFARDTRKKRGDDSAK